MPLYEYQCKSCEERFSVLMKMGEATKTQDCPECGEESPRVFSVPALIRVEGGATFSKRGREDTVYPDVKALPDWEV